MSNKSLLIILNFWRNVRFLNKWFVGYVPCWPRDLSAKWLVCQVTCQPSVLSTKWFVDQVTWRPIEIIIFISSQMECQPNYISTKLNFNKMTCGRSGYVYLSNLKLLSTVLLASRLVGQLVGIIFKSESGRYTQDHLNRSLIGIKHLNY